jgi:DNA-binding NtrC family response regulator
MESSASRRILVVDDDPPLLDALERAFREAGEAVVACASFAEARQALREQSFDALVTDIRLGEFNGLQLAVIARDAQPGSRIIVFSGFSDPVLQAEAERIGAIFRVKPVPSADLLELIRQPSLG